MMWQLQHTRLDKDFTASPALLHCQFIHPSHPKHAVTSLASWTMCPTRQCPCGAQGCGAGPPSCTKHTQASANGIQTASLPHSSLPPNSFNNIVCQPAHSHPESFQAEPSPDHTTAAYQHNRTQHVATAHKLCKPLHQQIPAHALIFLVDIHNARDQ